MTWQVTARGTGGNSATSNDVVISSFTPTADCLLLGLITHGGDSSISSISGHDSGATWVKIGNDIDAGGGYYLEIWGCFTGSSPSAGTVTVVKNGYIWNCSVYIVEVHEDSNGVDTSGTVANALGTPVSDGGYNTSPLTATLSAFDDSNNLTFTFAWSQSFTSYTFESAHTSLSVYSGYGVNQQPAYYGSEDTSMNVGHGAWSWANAAAFEVKQSSAAGDLSASVTETMTITEDLSPSMPLPGVSIAETMTITESIDIALPLSASIIDSITILEEIGESIPLSTQINQSITIEELIQAIKDLEDISVVDQMTITEWIDAALASAGELVASAADTMTIAEEITINLPIAASVTEQMTITETISILLDLLVSVTETMTAQDVVFAALSGTAMARKQGLLLGIY